MLHKWTLKINDFELLYIQQNYLLISFVQPTGQVDDAGDVSVLVGSVGLTVGDFEVLSSHPPHVFKQFSTTS